MMLRALIYGLDHSINRIIITTKGNWFIFNGRSYRKDRKAICQVEEKGNSIKGTIEALYVEGQPVPLRSVLDPETVTIDHLEEIMSEAGNKPRRSLLDLVFRR